MTPTVPDLDNFKTFMLEYMKHSLRGNRTSTGKARITQTFQAVRRKLALPFADISLTTANMDMKLYMITRGTCALSDETKIARIR